MRFNFTYAAATILLLAGILGFSGCDSTSADPAADGTVTVQLSGAAALDGDGLFAFLYAAGEHSIYTADRLLACNVGTLVADGLATIVLKVDDGDFSPAATNWVGTGGTSYDVYIATDDNADTDDEPATSTRAYRPVNFPMSVTINGDQTINLAYSDLVAYTGGTLNITVTGGADDDVMFFGVFRDGADPDTDDPVGFCEDAISAGSTTGPVQAISDEDTDPDTVWYGVDGTTYNVYVFVDVGNVHNGSSDGPQTGDRVYQFDYTQDGNKTQTVALADFGTM